MYPYWGEYDYAPGNYVEEEEGDGASCSTTTDDADPDDHSLSLPSNGYLPQGSQDKASLDAGTSQNTSAADTKPKKKRKRNPLSAEARERRNRKRRVNFFPRLLKSDIRRNYAQMFTNVINAYDAQLLRSFMSEFCLPAVQLIDFAPENIAYGLPPLVHQMGIRNIMRYWASNSVVIPDFVCQPLSVQLCVNPINNRSRVVCKTLFKGTKVLDVDIGDVDRQIIHVLRQKALSMSTPSDTSSSTSSSDEENGNEDTSEESSSLAVPVSLVPIRDSVKSRRLQALLEQRKGWEINLFRTKKLPKPMNPPIEISYEGAMILYLDENFRIDRVDFLGSEVNSFN
jgi:hypothetical protein